MEPHFGYFNNIWGTDRNPWSPKLSLFVPEHEHLMRFLFLWIMNEKKVRNAIFRKLKPKSEKITNEMFYFLNYTDNHQNSKLFIVGPQTKKFRQNLHNPLKNHMYNYNLVSGILPILYFITLVCFYFFTSFFQTNWAFCFITGFTSKLSSNIREELKNSIALL